MTKQLNELSKKRLANYIGSGGISKAANKLAKEEVEQIDEISKQRLHSYIMKASGNKIDKVIAGNNEKDKNKADKHYREVGKRWVGMNQALHKMRGTAKVKATEGVEMNYNELIESIVNNRPVDTKSIVDEILTQKIEEAVAAYQENFFVEEFGINEENIEEVIADLIDELELDDNESEDLDEVSKARLARYIRKASSDNADRSRQLGIDRANSDGSSNSYQKQSKAITKIAKRQNGINTAARKLATEEVEQIDEISAARVASYSIKALADRYKQNTKFNDAQSKKFKASRNLDRVKSAGKDPYESPESHQERIKRLEKRKNTADADSKKADKKVLNRTIGLARAGKRLANEEVEQIDDRKVLKK